MKKKTLIIIIVSAAVVTLTVLGILLGNFIHKYNNEKRLREAEEAYNSGMQRMEELDDIRRQSEEIDELIDKYNSEKRGY